MRVSDTQSKKAWKPKNPNRQLLLQSTGFMAIDDPDDPRNWAHIAKINDKDIKVVDEFIWHADSIIDKQEAVGAMTPADLDEMKEEMKIENRKIALDYLDEGNIFAKSQKLDIYKEVQQLTAGDYSKSIQVYIDHFVGLLPEAYKEAIQMDKKLEELQKDPEFMASIEKLKQMKPLLDIESE